MPDLDYSINGSATAPEPSTEIDLSTSREVEDERYVSKSAYRQSALDNRERRWNNAGTPPWTRKEFEEFKQDLLEMNRRMAEVD